MPDAPLLKDFIDRDSVTVVVRAVTDTTQDIDPDEILAEIFDDGWEGRALKARIRHIAVTIRARLPADYPTALAIMCRAGLEVEAGSFAAWSFNDFVEEFGVDHPDLSLPALEQFTKLASAEFAVRPFIRRYPERMAAQMLNWADDGDPLVRRLASEGYRPRLPWGMGVPELKRDPAPILPVLEKLRLDPSEDVRRSVANNLNDISKDHPDLVVRILNDWSDGSSDTRALTRHALRTLLKRGHGGALGLLGFSTQPMLGVGQISIEPASVAIGGSVHLEFSVKSLARTPQWLMIDYAVEYQNASRTGSRKVFKGKVVELAGGASVSVRRKISLKPMTTRRIFPGGHVVEVQVNGSVLGAARFEVVESPQRPQSQ